MFRSATTTVDTSPPRTAGADDDGRRRLNDLTWTRWMLWGNVIGAGAMAVTTLISPDSTASLVGLDGDPLLWRLVGSMWLGFATASAIGLTRPVMLPHCGEHRSVPLVVERPGPARERHL